MMSTNGDAADELTPAEELRDLLETLVAAMDLDGEVVVAETDELLTGSVEPCTQTAIYQERLVGIGIAAGIGRSHIRSPQRSIEIRVRLGFRRLIQV